MTILRKSSRVSVVIVCTTIVFLVGALDWVSGPDISTSIFYLIPIFIATWLINRRTGLTFSIAAALLWFITDYFTNTLVNSWVIPFWNAIVRLGFFLIVVYSLSALRRSRQRQEDLMTFVIHDLRAPLGNMLTALDLLQNSDFVSQQNSTQLKIISFGQSSGQRLLMLVNSLLDLSRLESGNLQVQKSSVTLTQLFAESISQLALTAEYRQITFEQLIEPRETAVFGDAALTQRIIVNLLNNAIKFSPERGVITLQAGLSNKGEVIISIHDQGPGIPVEWQQRVFAKYGQVSGGRSGGSGLGLTFCKLAVEAQNGRIWLESETNNGTTMFFSLPNAALT